MSKAARSGRRGDTCLSHRSARQAPTLGTVPDGLRGSLEALRPPLMPTGT